MSRQLALLFSLRFPVDYLLVIVCFNRAAEPVPEGESMREIDPEMTVVTVMECCAHEGQGQACQKGCREFVSAMPKG